MASFGAVALSRGGPDGYTMALSPRLWTSPFLTTKNTFLEVVPPLHHSALGFMVMRRQISDPVLSAGVSCVDEGPVLLSPRGSDKSGAGSKRSETLSLSTAAASNEASPMSCDDGEETFDLEPIGVSLEESGVLPSAGSAFHGTAGQCRPCAFANTEVGCRDGVHCRFCHLEHPVDGGKRIRPCKGKRERIRKFVDRLRREVDRYVASGRPAAVIAEHLSSLEFPPMIQDSERLRKFVSEQLRTHVEETHGFTLDHDIF